MAAGNLGALVADGPLVNGTALVATTIEDMWSGALYSPIPVGPGSSSRPGKKYELRAWGIWSTGASGTMIITPQTGAGTTLGVSATVTVPVSITNIPWFIHACFDVRTAGLAGTNGTMMGVGVFLSGGIAANTSPGANTVIPFGGTSAVLDTTIASNLTIRKTLSVAGSVTTMGVLWTDWN